MTDTWHIAQHTVCSPFLSIMIAVIHPVPFWGRGYNPRQRKDGFYRWVSLGSGRDTEQMKFVITMVNKEAQPGHGPFHSPLLFYPLFWPEHQSANGNLSGVNMMEKQVDGESSYPPARFTRYESLHPPSSPSPSTHERKRRHRDAKIYLYYDQGKTKH